MAIVKELYKTQPTGDIRLISKDASGRYEKINYTYGSPSATCHGWPRYKLEPALE